MMRYLFLFTLIYSLSIEAAVQLKTQSINWRGADGRGYDVFSEEEASQDIHFQVRSDEEKGPYFITCSAPNSGYERQASNGKDLLSYQIVHSAARPIPLREGDGSYYAIAFSLQKNGLLDLSYTVSIPKGQIVTPGSYSDSFFLILYKGRYGEHCEVSRNLVSLKIHVQSSIDISVDMQGKRFEQLSLGELQGPQTLSFNIFVKSNSGYALYLESENQSSLKHQGSQKNVSYQVKADGRPFNLAPGGRDIVKNLQKTGRQGRQHFVEIAVDAPPCISAGSYTDSLNISAISLD
ncbi:MAG: hypothetical protein K0S07_442 [Chlamydiales bacterium]|jgi:hypothetical protein|nr:hypothetical protein [Chlamydiales bacterium]